MMRAIRARLAPSDEGFSMVELLVYAMLSVVILSITGGMLIMSISTRIQVTDISQMSSTGQLIALSVQEGVRNASGPLTATTPEEQLGLSVGEMTATGQLMRARVAVGAVDGAIEWRCQAWFYSPETKAVYSAVDETGIIDDPVGFTETGNVHSPTAGSARWTLLGEGVELADTLLFFGVGTGDDGESITLRFAMTNDEDVRLVLIPSTIIKRSLVAEGTGPDACY